MISIPSWGCYYTWLRSASASSFNPSRHTWRDDIFTAPPNLLVLVRWTTNRTPVLPILWVPGADSVATYHFVAHHLQNQSLLTYSQHNCFVTVTLTILFRAMSVLLDALGLDMGVYSLHSLRRGEPQPHTGSVKIS